MTCKPLLFGSRDLVAGSDFEADVETRGRAIVIEEQDGWWVYGVNPGGIAGGGETPEDACAEFRRMLHAALLDLAEESMDFEGFKSSVVEFVRQTNTVNEREWSAVNRP